MTYRRTKPDSFKKKNRSRQRRKPVLALILFLLLIIIPIYRIYLRFELAGKGLDEEMKEVEEQFFSKCKTYHRKSYSGVILEVITSDDDLYPKLFKLENGVLIDPIFIWHNVRKLQEKDSVYKAPNTFTLDVYRGENYEQHFTLEKFASQSCD